jgi:ornithine--oxo-acid transaminase
MNSGAEAVETAIKCARKWGYMYKGIPEDHAEIIVCDGNFHGRTTTIISMSPEPQYREGFGPLTPGFVMVPYGDLDALAEAINEHTCAFLFEPIQGESGIHMPPPGYLKAACDLCARNHVLFVDDEIQTGLGRTGKMFATEHEAGVEPDMFILGKALGGGFYPVSCIATSDHIMSVFRPGDHGSTFGGNPLATSISLEALKIIEDEKLVQNSHDMGEYFMGKLRAMDVPSGVEVRGKGLFIGVELDRRARPYCEALAEAGVLCKETHDNVIRFAPPLVVTQADIDWACERIAPIMAKLL